MGLWWVATLVVVHLPPYHDLNWDTTGSMRARKRVGSGSGRSSNGSRVPARVSSDMDVESLRRAIKQRFCSVYCL